MRCLVRVDSQLSKHMCKILVCLCTARWDKYHGFQRTHWCLKHTIQLSPVQYMNNNASWTHNVWCTLPNAFFNFNLHVDKMVSLTDTRLLCWCRLVSTGTLASICSHSIDTWTILTGPTGMTFINIYWQQHKLLQLSNFYFYLFYLTFIYLFIYLTFLSNVCHVGRKVFISNLDTMRKT